MSIAAGFNLFIEIIKKFKKQIKSVAYSSQGSHTGQLDWQMAARRDNVISIKLHQV